MTTEQYQSILDALQLTPQYFTWRIANKDDNEVDDFITQYIETDMYGDVDAEKVLALMQHLGCDYQTTADEIDDGYRVVLTYDEVEDAMKDEADHYFDEIELPEVPQHLHRYLDKDAWVADYLEDGSAHILGKYDGIEYEVEVNGTIYYIYRQ